MYLFNYQRRTRGAIKGIQPLDRLTNKELLSPHRLDGLTILKTIPTICLAL